MLAFHGSYWLQNCHTFAEIGWTNKIVKHFFSRKNIKIWKASLYLTFSLTTSFLHLFFLSKILKEMQHFQVNHCCTIFTRIKCLSSFHQSCLWTSGKTTLRHIRPQINTSHLSSSASSLTTLRLSAMCKNTVNQKAQFLPLHTMTYLPEN